MQFKVQPFFGAPDVPRIESLLAEHDPAALVDFDAATAALRLSTTLDAHEVSIVLAAAGVEVEPSSVQRLPSDCCGGCGG